MSIQWTVAAWFLYAEIFIVTLLILPIFSATKSRIFQYISEKANFLFIFFICIISIFLLDAIREIYKYKRTEEIHSRKNANEWAAKEFRAQRNLYITGISLFLCFVIKRLVVLISNAADLAMEKKVIEIEKNTILNDFLILTEKFKPNENVEENESSLLEQSTSGNVNVEREETRSRSLSRTNVSFKKDE